MKKTVLLIDTNSAVQAITSLALNRIGVNVEQVTDASAAAARIRDLRPHLVLCATDMKGLDAYELCADLKADKTLRRIPFVVLEGGEDAATEAQTQSVDAVISKPFKSEQLRATVQELLAQSSQELNETDTVALVIENSLARAIVRRFITHHATEVAIFASVAEYVDACKKEHYPLTVIDWNGKSSLSWFNHEKMGTLVVVSYDERTKDHAELPPDVRIILRPLSFVKLEKGFHGFLQPPPDAGDEDLPPLESSEQALLAAKISVAVFQRLLVQDALRNRSWEEASAAVGAEALRVCLELEENS
jgi:CheY-like chemotaxis protein